MKHSYFGIPSEIGEGMLFLTGNMENFAYELQSYFDENKFYLK